MTGPEHVERLRVAWVDTDAGGRIHFTAAFRWAEVAEFELLRDLAVPGIHVADYPRRQAEAQYQRVLRFDDEFEVRLRPERVGSTSITYAWHVVRDGEVCIAGRHTAVHVDRTGRPSPLPSELRDALTGTPPDG